MRSIPNVGDILQAVALVFDHVLVEMQQSSSSMIADPASPLGTSDPSSAKGSDTPTARGHGTTNAALKLLDDLCMMATGNVLFSSWLLLYSCAGVCQMLLIVDA